MGYDYDWAASYETTNLILWIFCYFMEENVY